MKILLIGPRGQLGSDLMVALERAGHTIVPAEHSTLEVSDAAQVSSLIVKTVRPEVVINTSAFHKVEECELQPDRSFAVNAIGPLNLARACNQSGAVLLHFSTDYVFDGRKQTPYSEVDLPSPLNIYGASKVAGENLIACATERYFVVRTSGLYGQAGSSGKGGNFVETMLRKATNRETIRVVDDQFLTPTATADLALLVAQLITSNAFGLYHVSCEGHCSWFEFAREIFRFNGIQVDLSPVSTNDFPSPVKRPLFSVLSKRRLNELNFSMPDWHDSLERYLVARAERKHAISA